MRWGFAATTHASAWQTRVWLPLFRRAMTLASKHHQTSLPPSSPPAPPILPMADDRVASLQPRQEYVPSTGTHAFMKGPPPSPSPQHPPPTHVQPQVTSRTTPRPSAAAPLAAAHVQVCRPTAHTLHARCYTLSRVISHNDGGQHALGKHER